MSCRLLLFVLLGVMAAHAAAQQPLDTNLLTNGDFESGTLAGWTSIGGSATVMSWGADATVPPFSVSLAVGGGVYLLSDGSGNAKYRQTIDVSGNAADIAAGNLLCELGADLGGMGADGDAVRLRARFMNTTIGPNAQIGEFVLGEVTATNRNRESVVMRRRDRALIPAGTTEIRVDLECIYSNASVADGCADNIAMHLRQNAPAASVPLGVNLIVNGDFESGWTGSSPLVLNDERSWIGVAGGSATVETYGATSAIPSAALASAVSGGTHLLGDTGTNAAFRQSIDISGNAINGAGYEVTMEACLGGVGSDVDSAQITVDFRDSIGTLIGTAVLSPMTRENRNSETIVMRRRTSAPIPAFTRRIDVTAHFNYLNASVADGFLDNVDVRIQSASLPAAIPFGTELVVNGDFESGWSASSPLTPGDARGWSGSGAGTLVEAYGANGSVPGTAVGGVVAGGNKVCSDYGGGGSLHQDIDVRGNATAIDLGQAAVDCSALLGGIGNDADSCRVEVSFYSGLDAGAPAVGSTVVLQDVSRANRLSQSILLTRRAISLLPPLTRRIHVGVYFTYAAASVADGCCDNISVKLEPWSAPAPQPLGQQLLANGDFENGPVAPMPFVFGSEKDWEGQSTSGLSTEVYGSGPTIPSSLFSAGIGGGNRCAGDVGGGARIRQTFDVSANPEVAQGTLRVHAEGWFGGSGSDADTARLDVVAVNTVGGLTTIGAIGSVTPAMRAASGAPGAPTVLLFRSGDFTVPAGTVALRIELVMVYNSPSVADGLADNLQVTLYDSTQGGADHYPGSGAPTDLHLFTGLNATPTTGPAYDIKDAAAGDLLAIKLSSFSGNTDFAPVVIAYEPFTTGTPPVSVIPGVALEPMYSYILVDGITFAGFFGQPILVPGGVTFYSVVPAGLAGGSVLIQGFTFPSLAGLPAIPPNGVFFASAAHEIRFL